MDRELEETYCAPVSTEYVFEIIEALLPSLSVPLRALPKVRPPSKPKLAQRLAGSAAVFLLRIR